jgi:hypothetical protein
VNASEPRRPGAGIPPTSAGHSAFNRCGPPRHTTLVSRRGRCGHANAVPSATVSVTFMALPEFAYAALLSRTDCFGTKLRL